MRKYFFVFVLVLIGIPFVLVGCKSKPVPISSPVLSLTPTPVSAITPIPAIAPQYILENARFIVNVKNSLPLNQRGKLNTYGVYVQSGRNREPTLPQEGTLYMVGGRTIPKLIFLDEDSGETIVVKYTKGDWLKSLELSYEKANKVWVAMQTDDRASVMQALSIEEPDRPRYVDFDKRAGQ